MEQLEIAPRRGARPAIAVIGGGTGTSALLEGLSGFDVDLSAVVATTDDGGSTGELRRKHPGLIGLGDLRQCMRALAQDRERASQLDHRDEDGHAQGNLDLLNYALAAGGPEKIEDAICLLGVELKMQGQVIPVTLDDVHLTLSFPDGAYGEKVTGEQIIAYSKNKIKERRGIIGFDKPPELNPAAEEKLASASATIIAPGNFYGSVIPTLMTPDIIFAIAESNAPLIMVSNLKNDGNTSGFSLRNYLDELRRHTRIQPDIVIAHRSPGQPLPSCPSNIELITGDLEQLYQNSLDKRDPLAGIRSRIRHNGPMVGELALRKLALV